MGWLVAPDEGLGFRRMRDESKNQCPMFRAKP